MEFGTENTIYDVVIVGGGGAGMAAAISAADAGASVAVVEAATRPGGTTALSGGVFYGAGTSVQRAAGVQDTPERMFEYYMNLNQWELEPWLIRRMCEASGSTLDWLIGLGVEYPAELLYIAGVDDTPRGHKTPGGGIGLFNCLERAARARSVTVYNGVRVDSLIVEGGNLAGVSAARGKLRARSVILTTGGLGSDWASIEKYFPSAAQFGAERSVYFGADTVRGDAIRLGRDVDAAIVGHDRGCISLSPAFSLEGSNFFPPWVVMVNLEGRRFMSETAPYAVSAELVRAQTESRCFAILDEATRIQAPNLNPFTQAKVEGSDYLFSGERIKREADLGNVHVADTLELLAQRTGVHGGGLLHCVESYNVDVASGADKRFEKKGLMRPIATPPFYAVEIIPCAWAMTGAGPRIDPDAQVYSNSEMPIAGLYAAGEAAGGTVGSRYIGGGNGIADAIIFGKIAGESAAKHALKPE